VVIPIPTSNNKNLVLGSEVGGEGTLDVRKVAIPLKLFLLPLLEKGVPVLTGAELCVGLGQQIHEERVERRREDGGDKGDDAWTLLRRVTRETKSASRKEN
jgi:hypothetical protein